MNDVPSAFRSLSVIIPAYNAGRCIGRTLLETRRWLDQQAIPTEIIVVDDGSRDDTREVVQREGGVEVRLLCNPRNRGKGYSVRRGMLASCMEWALFMDADNSTSITHLARMANYAPSFPIIIASRRLPQSRIVRRQPMLRQMLGRSFPYLVRLLALPGIRDTQCGFKVFRHDAVQDIFSRQFGEGFAFDVELLLLAQRLQYRVAEVPVDWDNPHSSTVRIQWDTLHMLSEVVTCTWRLRLRGDIPERDPALLTQAQADRLLEQASVRRADV